MRETMKSRLGVEKKKRLSQGGNQNALFPIIESSEERRVPELKERKERITVPPLKKREQRRSGFGSWI